MKVFLALLLQSHLQQYMSAKPGAQQYNALQNIFFKSVHSSLAGLDSSQRRKRIASEWVLIKSDANWEEYMRKLQSKHAPFMPKKKTKPNPKSKIYSFFQRTQKSKRLTETQTQKIQRLQSQMQTLKADNKFIDAQRIKDQISLIQSDSNKVTNTAKAQNKTAKKHRKNLKRKYECTKQIEIGNKIEEIKLKIEQTTKVMNLMRTNDTQKEYEFYKGQLHILRSELCLSETKLTNMKRHNENMKRYRNKKRRQWKFQETGA
ncbi:MAG: hypothetical protein GY928_34560 [Colwellia sp.]|nr:hypothetical protein [Colwellia sp.]